MEPLFNLKKYFGWVFNRNFHKSVISKERPIILFSSCVDSERTGDFKYNGGVRGYNLWAKLLRSKGFESYIVTYDGKYEVWMNDHQPHISLKTAEQWKKMGKNLRFFTCWIGATAFNNLADKIYFHDCEVRYSFGIHFPILKKFIKSGKIHLSAETRAEQAYYRSKLNLDTRLIPPYSDPEYFYHDDCVRVPNRIGYNIETANTKDLIKKIKTSLCKNNIKVEFVVPSGNENEYNSALRSCDFYLGLNPGKDDFHSEGLARVYMEAMELGAVVVAFDVGGNREFLFDHVTGRLIEQGNLKQLIEALIYLILHPEKKEELRKNALWVCNHIFTMERAWPELKHFLNLDGFPDKDPVLEG